MKTFATQGCFLIHALPPLLYIASSLSILISSILCAENIQELHNSRGEISSISEPKAEAWVGVIDQINPPWVIIEGERGERAVMPMRSTSTSLIEGQWVVVWVRAGRIEPLNPAFAQAILLFIELQKERLLRPL